MALTKVTGSVIKDSVSLSGNVSVGGTLTYQDVTNVDALGIGTFRTGIKVLAGQVDVGNNIKLGNAGVITATSFSGVMSGTTGSFSGQVNVGSNIKLGTAGVVTATSFVGSGTNLTGIDTDLVSDSSPQLGGLLESNGSNIKMADSDIIVVGTGNDLQISHSSNISRLRGATTNDIHIESAANFKVRHQDTDGSNAEDMLICTGDGAVELYHNNTKTFETTNEGATFDTGSSSCVVRLTSNTDAVTVLQGFNSDFNIKAPSGGAVIIQANANEDAIKCLSNGAVELYNDGTKQCQTFDGGMNWQDNKKAEFGASGDLKLYHNGTDSYISNGTNKLRIGNTHNNEIKFFTQNSTRWNVGGTGHIYPDLNNAYDIGTTTYRVRNIYTNDLNLSNEGSTNSVDNTWGNYTIQEGESDLFLINNRSGKKYKFNLTEVS